MEFKKKEGIWILDTRFLKITKCDVYPEKFYILDSEPLSYTELHRFLKIIEEGRFHEWINCTVAEGFWALKYIYIISKGEDQYYILSRFYKKILWKNFLTA